MTFSSKRWKSQLVLDDRGGGRRQGDRWHRIRQIQGVGRINESRLHRCNETSRRHRSRPGHHLSPRQVQEQGQSDLSLASRSFSLLSSPLVDLFAVVRANKRRDGRTKRLTHAHALIVRSKQPPGYGVVSSPLAFEILSAAGITDITCKVHGSHNILNTFASSSRLSPSPALLSHAKARAERAASSRPSGSARIHAQRHSNSGSSTRTNTSSTTPTARPNTTEPQAPLFQPSPPFSVILLVLETNITSHISHLSSLISHLTSPISHLSSGLWKERDFCPV